MNCHRIRKIIIFTLYTVSLLSYSVVRSQNLIPNGDMNQWTQHKERPDNYSYVIGETKTALYFHAKGNEYFQEKKNSLQLKFESETSSTTRTIITPLTENLLFPGKYQLSFYLKGSGWLRSVNLVHKDLSKSRDSIKTGDIKRGSNKLKISFPTGKGGKAQLYADWTKIEVDYVVDVPGKYCVGFNHNNRMGDVNKPFMIADIQLKLIQLHDYLPQNAAEASQIESKSGISGDRIPVYTQQFSMPDLTDGPVPIPETNEYWQSDLVKINEHGSLTYYPDKDGYVLPDFSHAGYKGGDEDIPLVHIVKTIEPVKGDNTLHIQSAIDEMKKLRPDAKGVRGTILLKKGLYSVKGPINVNIDGVLIRGEGNGTNPDSATIIFDWYKDEDSSVSKRDVFVLGNHTGSWDYQKNNEAFILDDVLPVGSYTVRIPKNTNYKVGDKVCIYHPCTDEWLQSINYGEVGGPTFVQRFAWTNKTAPILYNRYVKQVKHTANETRIELDAPFYYTMYRNLSPYSIYRFTDRVVQNIGLENLRIVINGNSDTDEHHAWRAISFRNIENSWAKDVICSGFGMSGISFFRSTRCTVENCAAIFPSAMRECERRYNFNLSKESQLILFKDCYTNFGRHAYVSNGTSTVSGIVFYRCRAEGSSTRSEGHRMWTQGMLFDNYEDYNPYSTKSTLPVLSLFNRWEWGSGHGWSAVNSVIWRANVNTDVNSPQAQINSSKQTRSIINVEKPPTSQNYAIGCFVRSVEDIKPYKKNIGYVEGTNKAGLQPSSLYQAQLDARRNMMSDK